VASIIAIFRRKLPRISGLVRAPIRASISARSGSKEAAAAHRPCMRIALVAVMRARSHARSST
jgi:hypothetical protein